jgi:O-antigen/teichoic acid export membrane protein
MHGHGKKGVYMQRQKLNEEFKRYLNNTSYLLFDKLLKLSLGFFVIVLLTRYLGPEQFGILTYAQTIVGVMLAVSSLGISQLIVRDIVTEFSKDAEVIGTSILLVILSSILIVSISLLFLFFYSDDKQSATLISVISFTVLFQAIFLVVEAYFQSKVLSKYIAIISSIVFFISSALKLFLIYLNANLLYFGYALLFDSVFLCFASLYILQKQGVPIFKLKFSFSLAYKYLRLCLPLVFTALTMMLYTRVDLMMLQNLIGSESVGYYAAALRVSELLYFVPVAIMASLYPKLIELRKENRQKYFLFIEKLYFFMFWFSLLISLVLMGFSHLIVAVLYGELYLNSVEILMVLSFGIIFISVNSVFIKFLYSEGMEKKYLYMGIIGLVLNIILNYGLIPLYGNVGAAISTIISMFFVTFLYDLLSKKLRTYYHLKSKGIFHVKRHL